METLDLVWLVPAIPLVGFLLLLVLGRRLGEPAAGWVATVACGAAFLVTAVLFLTMLGEDEHSRSHVYNLFDWIHVGGFDVKVGFLADPLSIVMALFITGIGTLIHLYSIGYMHGDPKFSKFFVYMNLFVFSMLMLVLGSNMLITFLGWEGVGACSYFLIAFWFSNEANASAGKKAFVTNRIGDWGFMTAMFLTFATVGSLDYSIVLEQAPAIAPVTATAIALLLFLGRMREVGPAAPLRLAPGRDGRTHPGLGPDPRRHHGHRGRLPHDPREPDPRPELRLGPRADRVGGGAHRPVRRHDRGGPERHQEGAGLLHHQPAGVHVPRHRQRRLRGRHLPHDHARVLQGAALPRCRLGDPRDARRAGHAAHGRTPAGDADHRRDLHRRLAGHRGRAALRRLLVQGRDPALRLRQQPCALGRRPGDGGHHRLLHEPSGLHGLLRGPALGRRHRGRGVGGRRPPRRRARTSRRG